MAVTKSRQLFLAVILTMIGVGIILDQAGYPVRSLVQTATTPVQRVLMVIGTEINRQTAQSGNLESLQIRVAQLEALNNKLLVENVHLKEAERENRELRQLLNFTRNNPQFSYEAAAVVGHSIGYDPTNLLYYVYVDVGVRQGIAENMPVVTERGLVGRVTAVGPNWSQVLLLVDPGSAVNALIQNNRVMGVVRGNIDGTLTMDQIPQTEKISPGDLVLTSGLGGNFPSKLLIGQVTEILKRDQDTFQVARIRPTVDFWKLEDLLIITSFEPIDFEEEFLDLQEADN